MRIQQYEQMLYGNSVHRTNSGKLINSSGIEYDVLGEPDEYGDRTEYIESAPGELIPVEDFIMYDETLFCQIYKTETAKRSYENFKKEYSVLSGLEIIEAYRDQIIKKREEQEALKSLKEESFTCGGF